MGFRLSVQALLPIAKETLVYGSADAGHEFESSNEEAKRMMECIGEKLYLKPHICVDAHGTEHTIIGPADIEIHQGIGKHAYLYVIDAARLMPPDVNVNALTSVFYQQFRPEFMKWYKKPLSSDAYSRFGLSGSEIHNKEVLEASRVLREERVPKFAQMIKPPNKKDKTLNWVSVEMQHRGINAR